MDESSDFQCLRCATCCRSLLESKGDITLGLPLTEHEASLFPEKLVVPKVAVGVDKPESVILYQLKVKCCPHLSSQNQCQIYVKRPLMCQSFPIVAGAVSNRCRVFSYRKPGLSYHEPYSMEAQLVASGKLEKYLLKQIKKNNRPELKIWEYDLNSKKWRLQGPL